jgi:hypothetical protein
MVRSSEILEDDHSGFGVTRSETLTGGMNGGVSGSGSEDRSKSDRGSNEMPTDKRAVIDQGKNS